MFYEIGELFNPKSDHNSRHHLGPPQASPGPRRPYSREKLTEAMLAPKQEGSFPWKVSNWMDLHLDGLERVCTGSGQSRDAGWYEAHVREAHLVAG